MIKIANNILSLIKFAYEDSNEDENAYYWSANRGSSLLGREVGNFEHIYAKKPKNLGKAVQKELIRALTHFDKMEKEFNKDMKDTNIRAEVYPYTDYYSMNSEKPYLSSAEVLEKIKALSPEALKGISIKKIPKNKQYEGEEYDTNLDSLEVEGVLPASLYESAITIHGLQDIRKGIEKMYGKSYEEINDDYDTPYIAPDAILYDRKLRKKLLKYIDKKNSGFLASIFG